MFSADVPENKNLRIPLSRVVAATNKNTPIENCVLIRATQPDILLLTAVDSRTHQLTLRVPEVSIWNDGEAIVTADVFNRMITSVGDNEQVQLGVEAADNKLVLQADTAVDMDLFTSPVSDFPVETQLPPVVGTVDAKDFIKVIQKALKLSEKDEFISFKAQGDQLGVYTRSASGRLFSRTRLQLMESVGDWAISIPMVLLSRLMTNAGGVAELRLNEGHDIFAIAVGDESLLIRQLATDTISPLIDALAARQTPNDFVVKSDPLKPDLKRANYLKDKRGMNFKHDTKAHVMRCSYGATGKAHVSTPHALVQVNGVIPELFMDPKLLEKAVEALECVDMFHEVITEQIPSDPPVDAHTLRLTDYEAQDHRVILVTTLQG